MRKKKEKKNAKTEEKEPKRSFVRSFVRSLTLNPPPKKQITSDDQAQKFCEYWLENDKKSFKNARLVKAGLNQDYNVLYCVFEIVHN